MGQQDSVKRIRIDYAYDRKSVEVGDVKKDFEYQNRLYDVKCIYHGWLNSVQWIAGGTIEYEVLEDVSEKDNKRRAIVAIYNLEKISGEDKEYIKDKILQADKETISRTADYISNMSYFSIEQKEEITEILKKVF